MEIMPAGNNLFDNGNGKSLGKLQSEDFHTMFVQDIFLSKGARPYIQPNISVLATRIISPKITY